MKALLICVLMAAVGYVGCGDEGDPETERWLYVESMCRPCGRCLTEGTYEECQQTWHHCGHLDYVDGRCLCVDDPDNIHLCREINGCVCEDGANCCGRNDYR